MYVCMYMCVSKISVIPRAARARNLEHIWRAKTIECNASFPGHRVLIVQNVILTLGVLVLAISALG